MIEWQHEEVLTLGQAAKRLPRNSLGKALHVSTLYRWVLKGVRGVRLEAIPLGGTLYTSSEALQRFFASLARARDVVAASPAKSSGLEAAERELARHGL